MALAVGTVAFADDYNPPSWRLGNASATVQEWDFNTPSQPLAPDGNTWGSGGSGFVNPFGTPLMTTNASWAASIGTRNGIYQLTQPADVMSFDIPNHFGSNDVKDIWIQVTFLDPTGGFPAVGIVSSSFTGPATFVSSQATADGFTQATWSARFGPCPQNEVIQIAGHLPGAIVFVDQVVIDTICNPVPEPSSLAILGAGAIAVVRKRRRKL